MKFGYNLLFASTIFVCLFMTKVMAYEPPTGIPDPAWGNLHPIDSLAPDAPAGWPSSEVPKFYYIDSDHPLATNSGNNYGYPDKPRTSIPEITYEAGSYVEIHNGPYTGGGQIIMTANGTEAEPVWIRGASTSSKATIRGEIILKGSYVFMENLYFDTPRRTLSLRPHNSSTLDHAVVRNSEFAGDGQSDGSSAVIGVYGTLSGRFHDIVVYNNSIHDFGDDDADEENDFHAIKVSTNVDNVWILDNDIYNTGGDSVQVGTASTADENRVSNIYIGRNNMYGGLENAIDTKEADNIVISSNHIYDWQEREGNSSTGSAVIIHDNTHNVWVINNTVHSAAVGLQATSGTDIWFIGNNIYNIHRSSFDSAWNGESAYSKGAGIHFRGSTTGGALNNTIHDADHGVQIISGVYDIRNNIISDRSELTGYDIIQESTTGNNTYENNLIFHANFESNVKNIDCTSCIVGQDPTFVNDKIGNKFAIQANSPARDAGSDISSVLSRFTASFGESIQLDLLGNSRLSGGSYEVGSHEFSADTHARPNPPSDIEIN